MKKQISDRYEPEEVEKKWIEFWEKNNSFLPDQTKKETFSIVIPPPNVTGNLHIGHALEHTLIDSIIRIERLKGKNVVWIPGMDHAGIATQIVVEKQLAKKGKKRTDYTREEFEALIWEWKKDSGGQITHQQRMLGESVDWSRARFTMDEGLSKAVFKVFRTLYDEKLIYRGERIINWCPASLTAISDIEVEFRETKGHLYHIRYPFANQKGYIVVATTRPETMLGDVAVCAHPEDERYAKFKDAKLILPILNREIPLLFDSFVDKEFGSGLVKITPAHDLNDFEAGQRLGLTPINIMNPDATLNSNAGKYEGMDRFVARKAIVEELKSLDLIEKIEDYTHSVGHNSRGGAVIEPYLSTQWFVNIKPLAEKAIEVVKNGSIQFVPKMWEKTYFEWMENIKDWCISRQLWWGHRIPAYYYTDGSFVVAESLTEALELTRKNKNNPNIQEKDLTQDSDVLDTWFSSGLWPFTSLGWPEKTEDLQKYYPTSILVTGFDIIFFWVARMIMFGMKFQSDVPFKKVLIHGLVRNKDGKKFSKSLGNTIDPLDLMKKYGTDSVRFFFAASLPEGKDMLFDESRLEGYRAFCNKIWNSTRFILMNLGEDFTISEPNQEKLEATDLWIQSRFDKTLSNYESAYAQYHFFEMASQIYDFIWGDFCDWYIELTKARIYGKSTPESKEIALQNLVSILKKSLALLHPFMPFITEEIYSAFSPNALTNSNWANPYSVNSENPKVKQIEYLAEIVSRVRAIRVELGIPHDKKCIIVVKSESDLLKEIIAKEQNSILQLAKAESISFDPKYIPEKNDSISALSIGELILPMKGLIDFEKEKVRLNKEKDTYLQDIEKIQKKLENSEFLSKAKPEVIEREKLKWEDLKSKLEITNKALENLK
ncbi:MAG: valine--tRNA ligase [Leptospiraceae bacterium]|nr:valine--tRNA ligase [Leptospiraceae bacterium]